MKNLFVEPIASFSGNWFCGQFAAFRLLFAERRLVRKQAWQVSRRGKVAKHKAGFLGLFPTAFLC
jgi:hypothetical protein